IHHNTIMTSLSIIFLLPCSAHLRFLHSFPTRRSSDLIIVPLLALQGVFTSAIGSINMVIPTKMIGDTVDYMEWKTGERNEGTTLDRKSTRLNSSHVSISYAVFCLKKKK